MGISQSAQAHFFRTLVVAGPLSKANKESLIGREPGDRLEVFTFCLILPRQIGEDFAAEISYIFTQRQLAVDVNVVNHDVLGILVSNTLGALLKFLPVFFGPPLAQIAMCVELAALIVEAVGEFMPYGAAGIAV